MKKIRKIYWNFRDRGQGKTFILFAFLIVMAILSIAGLCIKSVLSPKQNDNKFSENKTEISATTEDAVSDNATGNAKIMTTEAAEAADDSTEFMVIYNTEEGDTENSESTTEDQYSHIDTSECDGLLGFMPDNIYQNFTNDLKLKAAQENFDRAKLLDYQENDEENFSVINYIELYNFVPTGQQKILKVTFNLKDNQYNLEDTDLDENQITEMQNKKIKSENDEIKKEQKSEKKKFKSEKKKSKKSKKGGKKEK